MGSVHGGLGSTVTKIRRVMEGPQGRQYMYGVLGCVALLLFVYYYIL